MAGKRSETGTEAPPGRPPDGAPRPRPASPGDRGLRRLDRQIAFLARVAPPVGRVIRPVRERWGTMLRVPVALLLIAGSFLAILPVFGLWMLPLGLLVLAIDLPLLRPAVTTAIVRLRRLVTRLRRRR